MKLIDEFDKENNQQVFIHRSIKTRIETRYIILPGLFYDWFLYIDPLKQGLKHCSYGALSENFTVFIHRSIKTRIETKYKLIFGRNQWRFLYIDPLKQGLKHIQNKKMLAEDYEFLYIDPLKQGLKLIFWENISQFWESFYT